MSISNDPLRITIDKVAELLRGLGLDPVEPKDVRRIVIDPDGVEVVRYRRDENGQQFMGFGNQAITETITIGFER